MSNERLVSFLETSFLSPLLRVSTITDISYNGMDIFYEDRYEGRKRYDLLLSTSEVASFLRQIANFAGKQFNYMQPRMDISFSRYRLNAMYQSVVKVRDEPSFSFSLRIGQEGTAIQEDDVFFFGEAKELLLNALAKRESIVLAGETGAGKTELQKYLLLHLPPATRVIVIDNVEELEMARGDGEIDLTSWLVDENIPAASFSALIKNALRNNPDYLLVAESRGAEMLDALSSVMSGHPIITTLHAKDVRAIPDRIARMAMMGNDKLLFSEVLDDVYHHFSLVVYVRKLFRDGKVLRYIAEVGRLNEKSRSVDLLIDRKEEENG